jgi:nitrogen regulatory protein P-II 1
MKEIKAIVRLERLDDVLHAIRQVPDVSGVTVSSVEGFGRTVAGGSEEPGYGHVPMSKVETVVPNEHLGAVLEAIVGAARTGRAGDGKIFVTTIQQTVDIRGGLAGDPP